MWSAVMGRPIGDAKRTSVAVYNVTLEKRTALRLPAPQAGHEVHDPRGCAVRNLRARAAHPQASTFRSFKRDRPQPALTDGGDGQLERSRAPSSLDLRGLEHGQVGRQA